MFEWGRRWLTSRLSRSSSAEPLHSQEADQPTTRHLSAGAPVYDSYEGRAYDVAAPPPYNACTLEQWASNVITYSSQHNETSWSANQVLGAPTVYPEHGDIVGAWATAVCDKRQFIEVEFGVPVRATEVNIYETYNPGGVVKVKARESITDQWVLLWGASRPVRLHESRIFSPPLPNVVTVMRIGQLRLEIDCTAANKWCEIDAIQLVGIRDGAVGPTDDSLNPEFISNMKLLVNNELHSDVTFDVEDKTVYGHKAILATRSPYFAKILNSVEPGESCSRLSLPDVPYRDILVVLHFIYTNRLPAKLPSTGLDSLLQVCSKCEIPEMKVAVTDKLFSKLSCKTVVNFFKLIEDDSSLDEMKTLCVSFMAIHIKKMAKEPSFVNLPHPVMMKVLQEVTMSM